MAETEHFYFDVEGTDISYTDEYGVGLFSIEEARAEAVGLAAALMNNARDLGENWRMVITVRNASKQAVYELCGTIEGRTLEDVVAAVEA